MRWAHAVCPDKPSICLFVEFPCSFLPLLPKPHQLPLLVVTGANAAVLTQSLQGSRVDPYDMNKFHVNIKRALLPAKVNVQCSHAGRWLTLASSNIALPNTPWPKTTKVGGAAGNGALANSNIHIAGLEQNYLPLSNIATLRSIINSKLGPIKKMGAC